MPDQKIKLHRVHHQYLKDHELDRNLKKTVQKEREVLSEILELLKEVQRRQLFLKMGYSSLFSYLTEGIGYSAASAMRRIDAMRLSLEIPEVSKQIQSGELSLSQVSEIQKVSREYLKSHKQEKDSSKLTKTKIQIIQELTASEARDHGTTQKIVAQGFDLPLIENTVQKIQKNESVRIELTLTKEQFEKLEKMKSLLSHVVPDGDLRSLIEYLSDRVIAQKSKVQSKPQNQKVQRLALPPKKIYQPLFHQHSTCQYVDPKSQKTCTSAWKLQVEHIMPRWAGGTDTPENLTVLCAAHNRFKYRQQSGMR
ncbi:MAG: HNH endonuclease [Pseudobdellovibrionaceae bacterium]